MGGLMFSLRTFFLKRAISYAEKNPAENLPKLLKWAHRFAVLPRHKAMIRKLSEISKDPDNNWHQFYQAACKNLNPLVQHKILTNFFVHAGLVGMGALEETRRRLGCNVPWAILMDPTAACNLHCTGCWAAEYDKAAALSLETLDRIIREGLALGIYIYLYSGGEPLLRFADIYRLAVKYPDCMFLAFTNAALVTEDLAEKMAAAGNIVLAISIEGFEEETDMRRGKGAYAHVVKAMRILKRYGLAYGFSTCYHSQNTDVVGSDAYIDFMVEMGCLFGWYFTYMPLGKHADTLLLASPEQREYMYRQVRKFRKEKPILVLDFWNDGEYVNGCIAGGRRYMHINANGDAEPCAFIHYADSNIHEHSLQEILTSPLFMQYSKRQPFNENHLRPCPLLDNPDSLVQMVTATQASSTQRVDREDVCVLADKCRQISSAWGQTAERLWNTCGVNKEQEG